MQGCRGTGRRRTRVCKVERQLPLRDVLRPISRLSPMMPVPVPNEQPPARIPVDVMDLPVERERPYQAPPVSRLRSRSGRLAGAGVRARGVDAEGHVAGAEGDSERARRAEGEQRHAAKGSLGGDGHAERGEGGAVEEASWRALQQPLVQQPHQVMRVRLFEEAVGCQLQGFRRRASAGVILHRDSKCSNQCRQRNARLRTQGEQRVRTADTVHRHACRQTRDHHTNLHSWNPCGAGSGIASG